MPRPLAALWDAPRDYRLSPAVYADAALNAFVRPASVRTPFDGGYLLQGLGGVNLGVRKDRNGIFVKTRVGVNSHSGLKWR